MIAYLMTVSGYSRQQLTWLVAQYVNTGRPRRRQRTTNRFARHYTAADIRLLAALDERHHAPKGFTRSRSSEFVQLNIEPLVMTVLKLSQLAA
ncbi:MAG: hypothetical protein L0H73_04465 [Nitrococcus sp.]|nr:hypothetical protein [Nitrococcus sp.]